MRAIGPSGLAGAILAAAVLSACGFAGKSGHEQLAEACTAAGEVPETCTCIVDAMEAELSPDLFKRTVVAIVREKRKVGDFILSLPDDEKMEFFRADQKMEACDLSDVPDE